MAEKITVWGTEEGIWGSVNTLRLYFKTKEERDKYFATHDHIDKLRAIKVDPEELRPALTDEWDENSVIPGAYVRVWICE